MINVEYRKHDEEEILEAVVSGELDFESAISLSAEARSKAKKMDYMLLKDLKGVTLEENILDALHFFDKDKNAKLEIKNKSVVAALIVKVENKSFWDFWETVASNNGMISRVFLTREKALEWLKSEGLKKKKQKENSE